MVYTKQTCDQLLATSPDRMRLAKRNKRKYLLTQMLTTAVSKKLNENINWIITLDSPIDQRAGKNVGLL